ncbi:hypothetical protein B0T19DRAFT_397332 [Cercophora scortea]|uniref:Uncharacterized protein n=1 Tax=Cercophora scortea TaxID=314031 RepID=A0AAE0J6A9_9PEZI|nr:hypothetical protein B0T19DRAFT_397332 [Cercophora scortea]
MEDEEDDYLADGLLHESRTYSAKHQTMHPPVLLLSILAALLGLTIAAQLPQGYAAAPNRNSTHLETAHIFNAPLAREDPHGSNYPFTSSRVWEAKLPSTLTSKTPSVPTETHEIPDARGGGGGGGGSSSRHGNGGGGGGGGGGSNGATGGGGQGVGAGVAIGAATNPAPGGAGTRGRNISACNRPAMGVFWAVFSVVSWMAMK